MSGCVDGLGRCEEGERERAWPIETQSVLGVKGQPPESVNAVTVGTIQSQCRSHIDQTWAHVDTLTHTLAFFLAHTQTIQHSFMLPNGSCFSVHTQREFKCICTHLLTRLMLFKDKEADRSLTTVRFKLQQQRQTSSDFICVSYQSFNFDTADRPVQFQPMCHRMLK